MELSSPYPLIKHHDNCSFTEKSTFTGHRVLASLSRKKHISLHGYYYLSQCKNTPYRMTKNFLACAWTPQWLLVHSFHCSLSINQVFTVHQLLKEHRVSKSLSQSNQTSMHATFMQQWVGLMVFQIQTVCLWSCCRRDSITMKLRMKFGLAFWRRWDWDGVFVTRNKDTFN